MLKNLWYVVVPSRELGTALMPVSLLGQSFVAYRDSRHVAHLLSDTCVHRGGSLSAGVKTGDTVQCPYHGWRFGSDGVCTHIPAQPDARIPAKARVDAYPVIERFGWIWAFLGDLPEAERPPLPDLGWVDHPSFHIVSGRFDWDASWDRVIENGLDFAHAPFVHGSVFGDRERPEMDAFDVVADDWQGTATMIMHRPVRKGWLRRKSTGERVHVETRPGFHMSGPCTTLSLRPRAGWRIEIVSAHTPIDATHTRTWWMMGRTFFRSALFDRQAARRNLLVFEQDHEVLRRVKPERVPDDWQREVSVKSDALQIAFRQRLHELEARGWAIDEARVERDFRGRIACVIPSPARRHIKTWAIEPIPIREGAHDPS
ncbi:aromatic ring-hydroxylating dioxygenase subunit alpha [Pararobbsia silviterrae]|uniref:Aromatic ring-hydroxylating dioxygenase subunit alpha n=1 Tax=Pararobbsia silviterrae TaxID=1792498 RepID=A0A494Y6A5_9BURK|nr:aromatic ring-hydroxylating dioxygenase subunit alpha [Pararobbsia silviterrae]RKP57833.1 aromatic ring-hydroxylating dioxygenase subunit alpha [Pararobbsia silviterrae]